MLARLPRKPLIIGLAVIAALVIPGNVSPYLLNVLTLALIFGIVAIGLDILMGYTGLDSLGQAAFYGTGAYALGILTVSYEVNWFLAAGAGLVLAVVLAVVFGFVAVRLGGLYFLLITLAFGQVLWGGVQRWGEFTGGFNGLSGVPMPMDFMNDPINFCFVVLAIFAVVLIIGRLVVSSPYGLALEGCRDDEQRMSTMGFRPFRLKWIAFIIAGLIAAVGGILSASFNAFVSPSDMDLQLSFAIMLMVIVGGAGYIYGAIVGAFIVTLLQYELSVYIEDWWLFVLGGAYVVTAVFLPKGILGTLHRRWRWTGRKEPLVLDEAPLPAATVEAAETGEAEPLRPVPVGAEAEPATALAPARHGADGTGKAMLELDGIGLSFGGFRVLNDVSLRFTEGERTAIIGPNGAGKTTLFNVISGLYRPSSGAITVAGTDLTSRATHARPAVGLARTFQVTKVFGPLTVKENMMLGLLGWTERGRQYTMLRPRDRIGSLNERVERELDRIGLLPYADEEVDSLSYGHQKQLDIGLALASEPALLLLDEPTAGLSQSEALRMMNLVASLPSEITVLIIEHNLDFLFNLTDRLVVLESGRVLLDGPQDEVRRSEEVKKIYFGSKG